MPLQVIRATKGRRERNLKSFCFCEKTEAKVKVYEGLMLARSIAYRRLRLTSDANVGKHLVSGGQVLRVIEVSEGMQRSRIRSQDRPAKKLQITLRKPATPQDKGSHGLGRAPTTPAPEPAAQPTATSCEMSLMQAKQYKRLLEEGRDIASVLATLATSNVCVLDAFQLLSR